MFATSEMPKMVVANVVKIARAKLRSRFGGGPKFIGIIGGNMPGMPCIGGIGPGGIGIGGSCCIVGPPLPLGGGGGENAPRGSTGPCPGGGGCGTIILLRLMTSVQHVPRRAWFDYIADLQFAICDLQLEEFYPRFFFGAGYSAVTVPAVPPRTANCPTTVICRGFSTATRSSRI